MARVQTYLESYQKMMKSLQRQTTGYAVIVVMLLGVTIIISSWDFGASGQFKSLVEVVRYWFCFALVCAALVFSTLSLWSLGRYFYLLH